MKKIEKNCKKIVKTVNKTAKHHPVAAVTTGAVTGALAITGASFLVEKAVGKVVCAIRSKRSEKKKWRIIEGLTPLLFFFVFYFLYATRICDDGFDL